jgi:spore coat polysaccharide biosynthesis protein SpsF
MKVVGTIEARMGSSRSPGKTLTELVPGLPLLAAVHARFTRCRRVDEVWVATTDRPGDDPIAAWCDAHRVHCNRGSEDDVLDRVAKTVERAGADVVVQMGADSAYLDFELIDSLVDVFHRGGHDYVCNDLELTFPLGIYGHVLAAHTLTELNARRDLSSEDREDVVRPIFEHPECYRLFNVTAPAERRYPELRLTVDYPEDITLAREIYRRFGGAGFTTDDLLALYRREPELFAGVRYLVQRSAAFIKKPAHA